MKGGWPCVTFADGLALTPKGARSPALTAPGTHRTHTPHTPPHSLTDARSHASRAYAGPPSVARAGAGAASRFAIGIVVVMGMLIGTLFTLFVVPAMYLLMAADHHADAKADEEIESAPSTAPTHSH